MNKKGFSLLEMILYIGIAAVILLVVSILLTTVIQIRVKTEVINEVEQQGAQVMQTITQTIRNGNTINNTLPGASAPSLSLSVVNPSNDPTIIDQATNSIQITEGANPSQQLTNSRVIISDLLFENLSRPDTPGLIRISFTLTHINPENKNIYDYSKIFYASAAIR